MSEEPLAVQTADDDDLLWQQLKSIPAFRALLRSVEARFYQVIDLPQPILDVGCGDGHFAQVTFAAPLTAGIDPWWGPLQKAKRSGMYGLPLQALGDALPFPDHSFGSGFSNSVLEHIPDLQPVLNEVSRVMKPGAPFVLTVPSHYFTEFLGGAQLFERLGLDGMAGAYRTGFNRISRHAHTDPPDVWADRLALAGFAIERWQYYFSQEALRTLELGHAQGIPSAILHALTGHWILGPWRSNLKWTEQWVRPYYEESFPEQGAYLYFLARKSADGPLEAVLPPPRPYTMEELTAATTLAPPEPEAAPDPEQPEQEQPSTVPAAAATSEGQPEADAGMGSLRLLVPGALIAFTLLFAAAGQSAWRAAPDQPGGGLQWFALSLVPLLLLLWLHRGSQAREEAWRWPSLASISGRRWLIVPALVLSFIAFSVASPNSYPALAPLALWAGALVLAFYSLDREEPALARQKARSLPEREERMTSLRIGVLLFLVALLLRIYDLAQHPFILNGTEASIGLNVLDVLNGLQRNPFSTGWLTNPSLPFFLQAIPLRLLGPSTASIRWLSAFVGAISVPVIYLIGRRLYGSLAGLAAAILLTGSHFHVHYSRSGLTNVWDGLLVLLALGLLAIAWQGPSSGSRRAWLFAGLATGLNIYLYTSSHLVPIMLALLFLLVLLFDSATLRAQWRNIAAMILLALVVALPQLLFYRGNPGLFMERAQALGILSNQTGWLGDEALRTGASQLEVLGQQFWKAALAFNATIDTGTSYGPLVPLVDYVFGLFFVLGLLLAVIRLRRLPYSILVVWVAVTAVFAGALLLDPPESRRFIIAMPAVCLLAAIALRDMVAVLFTGRQAAVKTNAAPQPTNRVRAATIVVALVTIAVALYNSAYYFGSYRVEHRFGDRNTEIADQMAGYLNELNGDWVAHFYGPPYMYADFPTIPFLSRNFTPGDNLFDIEEGASPATGYERTNQVFLFIPERMDEMERVRSSYPGGTERRFSGYYADPLFYAYEVADTP